MKHIQRVVKTKGHKDDISEPHAMNSGVGKGEQKLYYTIYSWAAMGNISLNGIGI